MPRAFIARTIPKAGLDLLRPHAELDVWGDRLPAPRSALLERVRGVDGILSLLTDRIDAEVMDAAGPQLKVISNLATGVDNVDLAEAARRKIPVGHTPGVLTDATADMAMALMLSAARRLPEGARALKAGDYVTWEPEFLLGQDVSQATLGIVGYGRIGRAVAQRAHAFGMRVLACSRGPISNPGVAIDVPLDRLLEESDFVSLHAPLTDATRNLIDARALSRMKRTAILINTARGGLVDHGALHQALTLGRIAAAALDVTEPEPINLDHPLLALPNCLVEPHLGSATVKVRARMAEIAALNLVAGMAGKPLLHRAY
jgi:lactate dehydrogenase-like 2-hydroxyacid dehydrogenase